MNTTYCGTLAVIDCCRCGVPFGVPEYLDQKNREENDRWFWCPNGHKQHYTKSEVRRLREQLDKERKRLKTMRTARDSAKRQASALKGVVTRTKKRIGKGVCPCCNRHFVNLGRHMAGQHPEYADSK